MTAIDQSARNFSISQGRVRGERKPGDGFGTKLRQARQAAGISQEELARRCDRTHSHVSRLESSRRATKRHASRETVLVLAEGLEADPVTRDDLLMAAGFGPVDRINLFTDEPELQDLMRFLADDVVPADAKTQMRAKVDAIVSQMRYRVQAAADWEAVS